MDLILSNFITDAPSVVLKADKPSSDCTKSIPHPSTNQQSTGHHTNGATDTASSIGKNTENKIPPTGLKVVSKSSSSADVELPKIATSTRSDKQTKKKYTKKDLPTDAHKDSSLLRNYKRDETHLKVELPAVPLPQEKLFSEEPIDSLEIHPHSKKNIVDLLNYKTLTMVQAMAIPRLLKGHDALIRAQTGSGKTFAYALPLVEQLHNIRPKINRTGGVLAIVIVPTRELALQTYEFLLKLLKPYTWIVPGYLCGGEKRKTEKARLRAGINILIATPGRFCDHIRNTKSLTLTCVRWVIIDEADRLFELGYEKDVNEIVNAIHSVQGSESDETAGSLQTVLLSATLSASVKELAGLALRNPTYVDTSKLNDEQHDTSVKADGIFDNSNDQLLNVDQYASIPATVKQRFLVVPPKSRLVALSGLIALEQHRKPSKLLVFMATQDLVDFHYDVMVEVLTVQKFAGSGSKIRTNTDTERSTTTGTSEDSDGKVLLPNVTIFKLHGRMTQTERSGVFQAFRNANASVLLCTDVVARGIDIPTVDVVVQFHAPQVLADYVHRVGRTARAGESGKAVLFVEAAEMEYIQYLANKHIRIQEQKIDGMFMILGQLMKCGAKRLTKNKEQAVIDLQHRYERLIGEEEQLTTSATKAFFSWVRYYSNFPKELRHIFAVKAIHMGHHATSLGLRDSPSQLMQTHTRSKQEKGNLSGSKPMGRKQPLKRRTGQGFPKQAAGSRTARNMLPSRRGGNLTNGASTFKMDTLDESGMTKRSRMLYTSEFASGLGPPRKKAKQA
ncbi:probable ATP-dependent RNA helicase CG8611 [Anopheles nili]|uniref:probable ATP-dependent RNA helicase CG8611 n=1 Tax=Anopheles nili TaxID=185578 RepID=UPI00237AB40F|nr:probable ATP-dependent RNA helicase CG8611 [Anopheles nili]